MASRKKQSEGIALLSMYNDDEEEDDEMEDPDEEAQPEHEEPDRPQGEDTGYEEPNRMDLDSATELSFVGDDVAVNEPAVSVPSPVQPFTPQLEQKAVILEAKRKAGRGRLTIVDYGHDEVAISPEPEEGEFTEGLRTDNDVSQQKTPGGAVQVLSPGIVTSQLSEHLEVSQTLGTTDTVLESEAVQVEATTVVSEQDVDPLDRFLPPPPKEKCPEELQKRIERFLSLKKVGRSFNAEVRNRKDYRNPDFLLHAVRYQDIDQIGSCFSKDVFDPHGYDKSDYYDEIELDMKRERERREQELKKSPKVEFVAGGTQPGLVVPPPKFSMPVSGVNASGLHSVPMTTDLFARDGRQSKKSKWDTIKVEPDGRNALPSGSHDSLSTAAAHAALLSANVGAGYTAFVQQKRREVEEKRSIDRKLERRS